MDNKPNYRASIGRFIGLLRANGLPLLSLFTAILLPLLLFGFLATTIRRDATQGIDVAILLWIHHFSAAEIDRFVSFLTIVAGAVGLPTLILLILALRHLQFIEQATFFAISVSGALCLNFCAKLFFGRMRPNLWISPVPESDASFPSGHAMMSMAIVLVIVLEFWPTRWRWPLVVAGSVAVAGIGLSRLYLGVHYPTDILAGWCASFTWVLGVHRVMNRIGKPNPVLQAPSP